MRKTTTLALIATGLVALGCGAGSTDTDAGSTDTGTGSNADAGGSKDEDEPETAKIGEPSRDGKFEFTVKSSECGITEIGTDMLGAKAQGQFCLVTINVKNISKKPQILDGSSQKAYTADGTEYSTDTEAGLYANLEQNTFFEEINPGNQVTGMFVFDVPKDVKLTKLELHDSAFSGGVTVSLN